MEDNQSFELFNIEDKNLIVTITDKKTKLPYDLTSCTVSWYIKKGSTPIEKSTSNGTIEFVDQKNGKIRVKIRKEDLTFTGRYIHYAKITDVLGEDTMLLTGTVEIKSI